ncbi:MAG TPA: OmpA family protein [Candidatus Methylomirabilis sp.]|nr:OmpA family protein [Candidatus Methylomirabilis sp.]
MKTSVNLMVRVALVFLSGHTALAHSGGQANAAYLNDSRGRLVTDSFGKCVRTSSWTRELTLQGRNPDVFPRKAEQTDLAPLSEAKPAPIVIPVAQPGTVVEQVTLSSDTLFDAGQADLKPQGKGELDALVAKLNSEKLSIGRITVTGHTDSTGAKTANQTLSLRRAETVKAYLIQKGFDPERIVTKGVGDRQPVASNETAAGRAQNRRVDIDIQGERTETSVN